MKQGVYKNLLQEVAQRELGRHCHCIQQSLLVLHLHVILLRTRNRLKKDAASAAWSALKQLVCEEVNSSNEPENNDEPEQIRIARALLNYRLKEKTAMANYPHVSPFPKKFPMQPERNPSCRQSSQSSYSKILPLFHPKSNSRSRPESPASTDGVSQMPGRTMDSLSASPRSRFPSAEAALYVPVGHYCMPCHSMAPSVTIRTGVSVFSAAPLPPPSACLQQLPPLMSHPPPIQMASPVRMRPASPMFASSAPVQGPKPVMPVQLKDVQDQSRKGPVLSVIPVQVKDVQYKPRKNSMCPVIPVLVKDAQGQPPASCGITINFNPSSDEGCM